MNSADERVRKEFNIGRDEFRHARIAEMQREGSVDAADCQQQLETVVHDLSAALRSLRLDNDVTALAESLEQPSANLDRLLAQARGDDNGEVDEVTMVARHMRMLR